MQFHKMKVKLQVEVISRLLAVEEVLHSWEGKACRLTVVFHSLEEKASHLTEVLGNTDTRQLCRQQGILRIALEEEESSWLLYYFAFVRAFLVLLLCDSEDENMCLYSGERD